MRFKTFRNFFLLPGGLLASLAFCGAIIFLASHINCGGGGDTTSASRQADRRTAQTAPASPVTPQPQRPAAPASSASGRDQAVIAVLESKRTQSGDKIKDALPRESYKVNVYRDGASPTWNRVKIDYDRDEKWDEKWDLEDGRPVKKQVSTADNDSYDREFRWQGGQWVEKKK